MSYANGQIIDFCQDCKAKIINLCKRKIHISATRSFHRLDIQKELGHDIFDKIRPKTQCLLKHGRNMPKQEQTDVLVVGGGIIGFSCAYYLNRAGFSVRLIEQGDVCSGASQGNCGLMFFSELLPLCQPGVVRKELRQLFDKTSPLYIKFDQDISKLMWLLRFAGKCNHAHLNRAMRARDKILALSKQLFLELMDQESPDCDWGRRGVLMVCKTQAAMDDYGKTNALLKPYGLTAKPLTKASLSRMEPALSPDVCGAWHHDTDSHVRPEKLVRALRDAVVGKGIVVDENRALKRFHMDGNRIRHAETEKGDIRARYYVMATGAWTPAVTRELRLRIPIQPAKGYSITMPRPAVCPQTPCYFYESRVVATPWADGLRLGGTLEFSGLNNSIDPLRMNSLRKAATSYLRSFDDDAVGEEWAGIRSMTYDDLPIIGETPGFPNLFLAAGHGIMGMTMATGTGRIIADLIGGKAPDFDMSAFSPARF